MTTVLSALLLGQRVREATCEQLVQDRAFLLDRVKQNPEDESYAQLQMYTTVVGLIEEEQERRVGITHLPLQVA